MRCPICGATMKGNAYKTVNGNDPHAGESFDYTVTQPQWLAERPISGHHYTCRCGCSLRVPIDALTPIYTELMNGRAK